MKAPRMIAAQSNRTMRVIRITLGLLIPSFALTLGWAVWTIPFNQAGLRSVVQTDMPRSGVDNPVTAVLLNFRGYDTLLEVSVLLIALLGVWSLPGGSRPQGVNISPAPGPILTAFARLLTPLTVLVQRRSTLRVPARVSRWGLLGLAGVGFAVFLGVALIGLATGGRLLEYPPGWTGPLILMIEVMLTLSIAVILVALFPGGLHPEPPSAIGQAPEKEAS